MIAVPLCFLTHSSVTWISPETDTHFCAAKISPFRLTGAQPLPSPVPLPANGGSSLVRILLRIFPLTVIAIIIWDETKFVKGFWGIF